MKTTQRIDLAQTQRLSLNAGLTASIHVLRADAVGLTRYLEEQAATNPHLALERPTVTEWSPRWVEAFGRSGAASGTDVVNMLGDTRSPSLMAHVSAAIMAQGFTPRDLGAALALADGLEPSGWLGLTVEDVAGELSVPVRTVEEVLARLQRFEPVGLFARSLAECLRLQAVDAEVMDPTLSCMLDHLDMLAQGAFAKLARMCMVPETEITRRLALLRSFDPKPGAQFAAAAAAVREPDLVATQGPDGGWQIALNRSSLPTVRLIRPSKTTAPHSDARGAWTAAQSLRRMVEQRNATLLKVGREVMIRQHPALTLGIGALVPMTMADVARSVELHESTISRVVAGTAVETPRGVWWLRALFGADMGGEVSTAALRDRLSRLVAAEDRARPMSDAALAEALSQGGIEVARRTVAKYRAMLHIPPAHRRKVSASARAVRVPMGRHGGA